MNVIEKIEKLLSEAVASGEIAMLEYVNMRDIFTTEKLSKYPRCKMHANILLLDPPEPDVVIDK